MYILFAVYMLEFWIVVAKSYNSVFVVIVYVMEILVVGNMCFGLLLL